MESPTNLVDAARATGLDCESSSSGRWVRMWSPTGRQLYLAEYAWGDDCSKHYLLFHPAGGEDDPVPAKFHSVTEALDAALAELQGAEPELEAVLLGI